MQSSRGQTRQVEMENVGIKLSLTPRMNPGGTVTLETDLERSDVGTAERSVELGPGGERADAIDVLSLQTTVCAKSGQTVVLGSLTERRGDGWTKLIALLTPQVLP